ncbi:MAG TPA: glycosyltransferase N-terminal domain-containing protein [Patescibacteria group bacterium]|nr:glycosyltransferase N-terminal domain-containing protein [Patescibacteria group bacterium]
MAIRDCLYILLLILSVPFWLKYVLKKKYRRLLKNRLRPQLDACSERSIWIHAVSVGEVSSVKSLIQQLGEKGHRIVLSVTTPAGLEFAHREYPAIAVIHAPLDFSFSVRRFIHCINPRLVIFNELELWPNWITLLHRKRIPILLINGRISEAAFARYRFFNFILQPFFRRIDCFLVQNTIYKKRFLQLKIPAEKIKVCGNIKADEAAMSRQKLPTPDEVRTHLRLEAITKKIVVLASSHSACEKILIPAIKPLRAIYFFIIVPRHVQRTTAIAGQMRRLGLKCAVFSQPQSMGPETQVLIYDRMGYLFPIMSISDIVFMGGTFDQKIGGHNLYEPAAMGKTILGGPCYNNFPDIGSELEENGVYHRVNDSGELLEFLKNFPSKDIKPINDRALNAILKRKGSISCSLKQIQRFLD